MIDSTPYANILKAIRHAKGFTQEELARELDVTVSTLSNWETSRHQPVKAQRKRIAVLAAESGVADEAEHQKTKDNRSSPDGKQIVQVLDLFSGCGGMSFGFQWASTRRLAYRVLGGLDVDKHANATFRSMHGRPALDMDVRELADPKVLQQALQQWGYDPTLPLILIGCAPCQGFSSHRKKDSRKDGRNHLLGAFAEVVVALKPELVVMENVPEMLQSKHWRHFSKFRKTVGEAGYTTRARILNLAWFGVPQERFRALVLCSTNPLRAEMPLPRLAPSQYKTVRDAISHLPPLAAGGECPNDLMHRTSKHRPETIKLLSMIPHNGGSRRSLPAGVGPDCHANVDGFRDVYGRLWWDRPAVAITARCRTPSCGRFVHPTQDRGLSIREAALLQGFPETFNFEGPFDDKYKQIGNAVSPTFAKCLAEHIETSWYGQAPTTDPEQDVTKAIPKSISSSLASLKKRAKQADQSLHLT